MARAREKDKAAKDPEQVQATGSGPTKEQEVAALETASRVQELLEQQPAPDDEPETPWYQFTDWWEGLTIPQAIAKLHTTATQEVIDWAVFPGALIADYYFYELRKPETQTTTQPQDMARSGSSNEEVKGLAHELLLEMIRAQGKWSPRYVEDAWTGAEAFVARSKGKQSGSRNQEVQDVE